MGAEVSSIPHIMMVYKRHGTELVLAQRGIGSMSKRKKWGLSILGAVMLICCICKVSARKYIQSQFSRHQITEELAERSENITISVNDLLEAGMKERADAGNETEAMDYKKTEILKKEQGSNETSRTHKRTSGVENSERGHSGAVNHGAKESADGNQQSGKEGRGQIERRQDHMEGNVTKSIADEEGQGGYSHELPIDKSDERSDISATRTFEGGEDMADNSHGNQLEDQKQIAADKEKSEGNSRIDNVKNRFHEKIESNAEKDHISSGETDKESNHSIPEEYELPIVFE